MKKRKIGFIALLGFLAVSAISVTTYAWFTQEGTKNDLTFTAGEVKYTISEITDNENPVVPGVAFFSQEISFTNESTIDTEFRMQISYTITTAANEDGKKLTGTSFTDETKDYILWTKDTSNQSTWDYSDGYYYYGSKTKGDASKIAAKTNITLFTANDSLMLNGDLVGNDYQGATITITFTFQAKQYDALTWEECANKQLDFTTGLKKKA